MSSEYGNVPAGVYIGASQHKREAPFAYGGSFETPQDTTPSSYQRLSASRKINPLQMEPAGGRSKLVSRGNQSVFMSSIMAHAAEQSLTADKSKT